MITKNSHSNIIISKIFLSCSVTSHPNLNAEVLTDNFFDFQKLGVDSALTMIKYFKLQKMKVSFNKSVNDKKMLIHFFAVEKKF